MFDEAWALSTSFTEGCPFNTCVHARVIPPEHDADFVAAMEDVLEVYHRPYEADFPVICMDEQPVQLTRETRTPLPVQPGQPARFDHEYERNGTACIFMFNEPKAGRRTVCATEQRTMTDWSHQIKHLLDEQYPDAKKVVLVCDNLNTHKPAALYKTFEPCSARRLLARLDIHHTPSTNLDKIGQPFLVDLSAPTNTRCDEGCPILSKFIGPPKHGSWLNMAEIELAALTRQCLHRRIPALPTLNTELAAWNTSRNAASAKIHWQFSTADARTKLKRLYPVIPD